MYRNALENIAAYSAVMAAAVLSWWGIITLLRGLTR